ncbi:hypothetical protein ACS0TY_004341 [Phlomoides rotata]
MHILDLSKIEPGKLILEETEFDLGRDLEGLVDMFSVQCITAGSMDSKDDDKRLTYSEKVQSAFTHVLKSMNRVCNNQSNTRG